MGVSSEQPAKPSLWAPSQPVGASLQPPAPPGAPSLPSHLFSAAVCSLLCTALLPSSSPTCLPPPSSSLWLSPTGQTGGTVATYRTLSGSSPKACCCSLASAQPGWEDGREKGGGRADLCLYSLPAGQGAWGEEFLCAALPIPLSLLLLLSQSLLGLCPGSGRRGLRAQGRREAGGRRLHNFATWQ